MGREDFPVLTCHNSGFAVTRAAPGQLWPLRILILLRRNRCTDAAQSTASTVCGHAAWGQRRAWTHATLDALVSSSITCI